MNLLCIMKRDAIKVYHDTPLLESLSMKLAQED